MFQPSVSIMRERTRLSKWMLSKMRERERQSSQEKSSFIQENHKIDETTGQAYTESVMALQSGDDRHWEHQTHTVRRDKSACTRLMDSKQMEPCQKIGRIKGPRSLQMIAIEIVIANISDMTLNLLESLPLRLVERLHHVLLERSRTSFHIWSIFSKVLHSGAGSVWRYHQTINSPRSPLDTYLKVATSTSFDFITNLSITLPLPIPDLTKLSKVINLGVLEIIHPGNPRQSAVSDLVVRAWSLSAQYECAFKVLRILILRNHWEITPKSLEYLQRFPALAIYDVQSCCFEYHDQFVSEARKFEWKFQLGNCNLSDPLTALEESLDKRYNTMRASLEINNSVPSVASNQKHYRSWDMIFCKSWEIIGELRDDVDLKRAGLSAGNGVGIGGRPMTIIPMACLRIGSVPPKIPDCNTWFSRIKLSDPERLEVCQKRSLDIASRVTSLTALVEPSLTHPRLRKLHTLVKTRKRKLKDLLDDFI